MIALTLIQSIGVAIAVVCFTCLAVVLACMWYGWSSMKEYEDEITRDQMRTDLEPQDLKDKANWFMCAWCKIHFSDQGQTSVEMPADWDGVQTSHGMCPKCAKFQLEEIEKLSPPAAFSQPPSSGAPPWRGQAGK